MCWIESIENLNIQISDKDIEVYKVVLEADKQSCVSCVQDFVYKANTLYKMPSTDSITHVRSALFLSTIICVEKAYHSYTKIQHTLKRTDACKYKGLIAGNQLTSIRFDNPYYVATFIIPKGSQYAINWKGEIISNQIIYTGKYLKLQIMCWACYANNLKAYKAEEDINVYKVVKNASKKLCVSEFTGFTYYKDTEPPELKLALHSNAHSGFLTIKEGYYSYNSVNFVPDSLGDSNFLGFTSKTIVLGTHRQLLSINNPIYLATFIIPKGSICFVNPLGVIVSSRIKYTGKYIKL